MHNPSTSFSDASLYTATAERKYLNAEEHARFIAQASAASPEIRLFALALAYTGMRLSEARALTYGAIQREARILSVRTLKRRDTLVVREIPLPQALLDAFAGTEGPAEDHIWHHFGQPIPRITAYRWIKRLMEAAGINGPKACPRGLRHAFGTKAILSGVPLHMLQRWMGHASMSTTAIYATVLGPEQLALSDRMWDGADFTSK